MSRRSRRRDGPTGFLLIDKEAGLTSHDVVGRLRKRFDTPAVGHAGTLDPDATGLLLVGVGKATRLLTFLVGLPKTYEATINFGAATSTQDAAGDVTATFDMSDLTPGAVAEAARAMEGDGEQVPPMVSAVRIDGKRLHVLAREGKEVDRPPRPVRIDRYEVEPTGDPQVYRAIVECSSGTYVRTLAHDLGIALGGGAHLATLRRTRVGEYSVNDAGRWEKAPLLPAAAAVVHMATLHADAEVLDMVRHGRVLPREVLGAAPDNPGPWAVFGPVETGDEPPVVAVYVDHKGSTLKPEVVLSIAESEV